MRRISIAGVGFWCVLNVSMAMPLLAGKPFRGPVSTLIPASKAIVMGQVLSLHPVYFRNERGEPQAVAKVKVLEQFYGGELRKTAGDFLVLTDYAQFVYDEKGRLMAKNTGWRYWLEPGPQRYLLFLDIEPDSSLYRPIDGGSGIINLDSDRPGDGPQYLDQLKTELKYREKK